MGDVNVVWYLMAHYAALLSLVPADRMEYGLISQASSLPALAVHRVSMVPRHTVAGTATEFCRSRVQVTVFASDYASQKAVMDQVRAAVGRNTGQTVAGIKVDNILLESEGPDFRDDTAGIFMGTLDFIVTFYQ